MGISVSAASILTKGTASANSLESNTNSNTFASLLNTGAASGPTASTANFALSSGTPDADTVYSSDPAVQTFMKYMNESTAQKYEDAWLAQHGLSAEKLKAMSPEKRNAIMKEMAEDMRKAIQQKLDNKLSNQQVQP